MIALFEDIIDCMNIPSLEIKKMYVVRGWIYMVLNCLERSGC